MPDTIDTAWRLAPRSSPDGRASGLSGSVLGLILASIAALALFGYLVLVATRAELSSLKRSGPIPTRYYLALMDQDYARAYRYLDRAATVDGRHVDARSFAALASAAARREGPVMGFTGTEAPGPRLTLSVQRGSGAYTVHLQLRREGNAVRIVSADGI